MIAFLTNRKCAGCYRPLWQVFRGGVTALICGHCDSPVR